MYSGQYMAKSSNKDAIHNEKNETSSHQLIIASGSIALIVLGAALFVFGNKLATDTYYFDSFARFLSDLRPTPAMLGKINYKIEALSSVSKMTGVILSVISFIALYLTLKGIDIYAWLMNAISGVVRYLGGREGAGKFFFLLGSFVLVQVFCIPLITTSGFFIRIAVSKWHFLAASFIAAVYFWALAKAFFKDRAVNIFIPSLVLLILVEGMSFFIAANVYDTAFDSQAYHQESIIYLAEGWNPVFESKQGDIKYDKVDSQVYTTSKSSEICAATIYKLTGNLEAGKAFNMLLIFASFCLSLAAIISFKIVPARFACFISFFMAMNPVSLYQSMSYYVDGQLSSILICVFSLLVLYLSKRGIAELIILGMSLAILLSNKLSGLAYALIICAGAALYEIFSGKLSRFIKAAAIPAVFLLLSFFCISFNPFVTNHINYGHVFHPFYGKAAISAENHGAAYIVGMNAPQKTFSSVFSESENYYAARLAEPAYKFPLLVSLKEIAVFANTDPRVAGFGPLFGAMIVCSFLMLVGCFAYDYRQALTGSLFIALLMIMVMALPEGWWARFVPQFYIVPFAVLVLSCFYKQKPILYMKLFMSVLVVVNCLLVAFPYYVNQAVTTVSLSRQLKEMKDMNSRLAVYMPFFSVSSGKRLQSSGIEYEEVGPDHFNREPRITAADFSVMYYDKLK